LRSREREDIVHLEIGILVSKKVASNPPPPKKIPKTQQLELKLVPNFWGQEPEPIAPVPKSQGPKLEMLPPVSIPVLG